MMKRRIKWGIIGTGAIAHKFVQDLKRVEEASIVAVASRSKNKADEFASQYQIGIAFGSYEDLFDEPDVDVVYIATPHHAHASWSIEAMKKGKHVLCEKPLGINGKEVEQMVQASKEYRVFLMEGLWTRFNPAMRKVLELVDQGLIGNLHQIQADFAFKADLDPNARLINPKLGGGSLLDIGIYPVFLAYQLLGKPKQIRAHAHYHENGADLHCSMIFIYDDAMASLSSNLLVHSDMKAKIYGSKGSLTLHSRWHCAEGFDHHGYEDQDHNTTHDLPIVGNGFTYEIEEVHGCIRNNQIESNDWSHQNSLDLVSILDDVRKKINLVYVNDGIL